MLVEIVTKEDLQRLRLQLLNDMTRLLGNRPEPKKAINWLTSKQVREKLNITNNTLASLRRKGEIKFKKVGAHYRYDCD
ncbi:MAG TPA: helix-turn-helix domain-containing protein [Mucilaginibacter sp.]